MKALVGWYGMAAILLAYALASTDASSSGGLAVTLLNGTGAAALLYTSARAGVTSLVALNGAWLLLALVALVRLA